MEGQQVASHGSEREAAFLGTCVTQLGMGSTEPFGEQLYNTVTFLAGFFHQAQCCSRQLKLSCGALYQHPRSNVERRLVPTVEAGAYLGRLLSQPSSVTLHGLVCSSELVSPSVKWAFWVLSALSCRN